ncbi:hypothetical protein [Burkholderia pseudomallei]
MKISRNLFKCFLALGMAAFSYASVAGTLVTFDNPMLLAMKEDGKVKPAVLEIDTVSRSK